MSPLRELLLDLLESGVAISFAVLIGGYLWGEIDSLRDAGVAARIVGVAFYGFVVYCIAAAVVSVSFGDWLEYTCAMVGALLPVGVIVYIIVTAIVN